MRWRLVSAAVAAGWMLFAGPVAAQEPSPSHLAAARDLVLVVGTSGSIDRIVPALVDEIRRQVITRPELSKDIEEVIKTIEPEMEQQRQQALLIAARSYAKFLTEQECRDAAAFFRSPVGSKYVKVQPAVTDDLVESITSWTQLAGQYLQTRVRSEMLKRGQQMQ